MKRRFVRPLVRLSFTFGLAACVLFPPADSGWISKWCDFCAPVSLAQAQTFATDLPNTRYDAGQTSDPSLGLGQPAKLEGDAHAAPVPLTTAAAPTNAVETPENGEIPVEAGLPRVRFSDSTSPGTAQPMATPVVTQQSANQPHSAGAEPRLALRWIIPDAVNLGQESDCRLVVTNTAADGANDVVVQVKLPENARLGQCDPPPSTSGHADSDQPLLWQLGSMAPGASKTIHVRLTPTATGKLSPAAAVAVTRITEASVAILEPRLELEILGPEHAVIGQSVKYLVNVSNHGSGSAANVIVKTQMTSGLSPDPGTQLQYQIGTLAAGETRQIELPARGTQEGDDQIEAVVQVGGVLATRGAHMTQIVRPALSISIDGPKLRYLDRNATYQINVQNPSPIPIHNIQVFHRVPEGFRFVEATDGGSFDSTVRQVAWFVGRLEPNSTTTVAAKLLPAALGNHTLSAAVRADAGVASQTETATRVEGVSSVVIDVSDRDDPVEVRGETIYTIRVSNQGSKPAGGVQVAAVLPKQMQVVSSDGPTDSVVEGDRVIFEPLDGLAPGQTRQYTVHVLCIQPGSTRFRAFLRTADVAEPIIEEEQTRVYAD